MVKCGKPAEMTAVYTKGAIEEQEDLCREHANEFIDTAMELIEMEEELR